MAEIYQVFASDWSHVLDFSEDALLQLYNYESYGGRVDSNNGYAHGKKWLNLHVTQWKEDISQGLLFKHELYEDSKFPHWWLDKILTNVHNNYGAWKHIKKELL